MSINDPAKKPDEAVFWRFVHKHRQRIADADATLASNLEFVGWPTNIGAEVLLRHEHDHIGRLLNLISAQRKDVM